MRRGSEEFEDAARAALQAGLLALLLAQPSSGSSQRPVGGSRLGSGKSELLFAVYQLRCQLSVTVALTPH